MSHFIPDDDVVASLLENSDIEEDSAEVSWDPNSFDLYLDFNPPDEPVAEYTEKWIKTAFNSKNILDKVPAERGPKQPMEYFSEYFPDNLFEKIADETKKTLIARGKHGNYCNTNFIKKFFGVHALMGVVRCPQKQLYFTPKFQYTPISNAMTYEKYRQIRISLSAVDADHPDEIEKLTNRLWKVQPVLEAVRSRCHQLERNSSHYSIGEQIINLVGPRLRTMNNWNKRTLGLKNFIVTDPQGLVVDFEIFQGSNTDLPDRHIGTGASIVLRLARTLPEACLYFGPNFTTIPLMNELAKRHINGTGLIMSCRWNGEYYKFKDKQKMGDIEEVSREDGKICVIKWTDTKPIIIMSTVYGVEPMKRFEKWDEDSRQHTKISCPLAIVNYKRNILGIGLANQIMELYSASFKSSKWTVNVILYLFDLAVTNSYIEYRIDCKTKTKQILDAAKFRLEIVEGLLGESLKTVNLNHSDGDITEIAPEMSNTNSNLYRPPSLASIDERFDGVNHWMLCDKSIKSQRFCRRERCKSRTNILCTKCKIYLCFNYNKNCFYTFHNRLDKKPD